MNHRLSNRAFFFVLLWLVAIGAAIGADAANATATGKRVALVIGNGQYQQLRPLNNPASDATAVAAKLKDMGFTLIGANGQPSGAAVLDLGENAFSLAVKRFARTAKGAEIALVYYAGHGMQIGERSYLLPVDVPGDDLDLVERNAISLERVLRRLDGKAELTVAVFDACREIPELERVVERETRASGLAAPKYRGLARVKSRGRSRIVAFAGAAGELVADGDGAHSPYTATLLAELDGGDQEVGNLFRQVAYRFGQTRGGQQPEVLIQGVPPRRFYFVAPVAPPPPPPVVPRPVALGYLQVRVDVPVAKVWVDGRPVGEVGEEQELNLTAGLPVGVHVVAVQAGDRRAERRETIRPNQYTIARFSLQPPVVAPLPEPPPASPPAARDHRQALAQCRRHFDALRLTTGRGGNAADCYRSVLAQTPDQPDALAGLAGIAERYRDWAEKAIARGQWDKAERNLKKLAGVDPAADGLDQLNERIAAGRSAAGSVATPVASPAAAGSPTGGRWTEPVTGLEFVRIPGGCFQMGSPAGEAGRFHDEKRHRVCVDAFAMATTEVTNAQYRLFKAGHSSGDYKGKSLNGDRQPAVSVSWTDATEFAEWLSRRTGKRFRLPTEAEWEYVARAGTTAARFWGEDPAGACGYANVHDQTSKRANGFDWTHHHCDDGRAVTAPVGSYRLNAYGLRDMLGNVWEWTCSRWASPYDGSEKTCVGKNQAKGADRVLRGGSWNFRPRLVRSAVRANWGPGYRGLDLGFRLLQDL